MLPRSERSSAINFSRVKLWPQACARKNAALGHKIAMDKPQPVTRSASQLSASKNSHDTRPTIPPFPTQSFIEGKQNDPC